MRVVIPYLKVVEEGDQGTLLYGMRWVCREERLPPVIHNRATTSVTLQFWVNYRVRNIEFIFKFHLRRDSTLPKSE
jgi:hypothetical protein